MSVCAKEIEGFADLYKCHEYIDTLLGKESPSKQEKSVNEQDSLKLTSEVERTLENFKRLTDIYLQQPELIEPHIGSLVQKITSGLIKLDIGSIRYHALFKLLYQIIKISGFKDVAKRFPHEVDKLPLLLDLLSAEKLDDKTNWETRFVLTVWLSIVVLAPFDLRKFDQSNEDGSQNTSERIYSLLKRNFALHDSCQQVTAFCLAKFFSRTDILTSGHYLNTFIKEALEEIANTKLGLASSTDDIKLIGYLRTLAYIYKFLPRYDVKHHSVSILECITNLDFDQIDRVLVNHLMIKVIQRAALSLMPARQASWRYKRAARVLGTLKEFSEGKATEGNLEITGGPKPFSAQIVDAPGDLMENADQQEEQDNIELLENVLSIFMMAAQNSQTRVRWSAAKGIARSASRLSKERATDVIDMVAEDFFKPQSSSSECAWHGGCLILAEMSRYGLILEDKLKRIISIVSEAIVYDKIKGSMATGAHIREAACYICWAMSRTYEDHILKPYIPTLTLNLLCNMLFDRELQCRRAASAAFQELIGRQGAFNENEIALLTDLDYHNVGQRQFAYLHLAPMVASRDSNYARVFSKHLITLKIGHWDAEIRSMACQALGALMLNCPQDFVESVVLPELTSMSKQSSDTNLKHGSMLALANVIASLVPLDYKFEDTFVELIGNLAETCVPLLKSKQHALKFTQAIGQLITSAERAKFKYEHDSKVILQWDSITLSALDSDNAEVRRIGADAFLSLYGFYYRLIKSSQDRLLTHANKTLSSANESSRCGALLALSRLSRVPSVLLTDGDSNSDSQAGGIRRDADMVDIVIISLTCYISKDTLEKLPNGDLIFAQAKAQACDSLVEFIRHLDDISLLTSSQLIQAAYDALLIKSEDSTFDRRGDIGVVVRQAAIRALKDLTLLLLSRNCKSIFSQERVTKTIGKILQQSIAYHDTAREVAGNSLYQLISSDDMPKGAIIDKQSILKLFSTYEVDDSFDWRNQSTPLLVRLLPRTPYSEDLWRGLLSGVGQLSAIGSKQFKVALADYLRNLDTDSTNLIQSFSPCDHHYQKTHTERELVFLSLMSLMDSIQPTDRNLMAALSLFDFLLSEGLLDEEICAERLCDFCCSLCDSGDLKRLLAVSRILATMLQFTEGVQLRALEYSLRLLTNRFAKVRVFSAEQLYLSLLTYQSDLENCLLKGPLEHTLSAHSSQSSSPADDSRQAMSGQEQTQEDQLDLNEAMELLSATRWDEPLDKIRPVQEQVCSLLLVKLN